MEPIYFNIPVCPNGRTDAFCYCAECNQLRDDAEFDDYQDSLES